MKRQIPNGNKRFLVNSYLFALMMFAFALLSVATVLFIHFVGGPRPVIADGGERIAALAFFFAIDAVFIVTAMINGYEMLGWIVVGEKAIELHAPFHKTIALSYQDIGYIGIDYCMLSVTKQFWIYLSKHPIADRCRHQINRLKPNANTVRVCYSTEVFAALSKALPAQQYKQLQRSLTTLRAHREI